MNNQDIVDKKSKGLLEKINIIASNDKKNSKIQIDDLTLEMDTKSEKDRMEEAIRLENERKYFAMEYLFWSILIFTVLFFQSNLGVKAANTDTVISQENIMEIEDSTDSDSFGNIVITEENPVKAASAIERSDSLMRWTIMIAALMVIMGILYTAKKIQEKLGREYKKGIQYHNLVKF